MRAIVVQELCGPEVMALAEHPDPVPGPGQVAAEVAVDAAAGLDLKGVAASVVQDPDRRTVS
ncbi:MAG TPA: hypothetical protein VH594_23715 [Trebonia sp.]|jgi:NADPH:quinone reductase-like Zn-dependent oxidoreductase